jgi:hypothetical protein
MEGKIADSVVFAPQYWLPQQLAVSHTLPALALEFAMSWYCRMWADHLMLTLGGDRGMSPGSCKANMRSTCLFHIVDASIRTCAGASKIVSKQEARNLAELEPRVMGIADLLLRAAGCQLRSCRRPPAGAKYARACKVHDTLVLLDLISYGPYNSQTPLLPLLPHFAPS